ncbi:hypothetical protein MKX01_038297 [Papaver californicum]|nr:hypothetical protein MKX01_038297 [Papaver californicum]
MGKHFKLRLSKVVLPLFQSCKSKDPSKLPENPLPLLLHLPLLRRPNSNTIDHQNVNDFPGFATCTVSPRPLKPYHRHQPSLKRQVSAAILSIGCSCRSKSNNTDEEENEFRWKIDGKWHVIDKINDDTTPQEEDGDSSNNNQASPLLIKMKKKRNKKNKFRSRVSTSSGDSGWFSSEEEEDQENDTQVSSSSEFFEPIRESPLDDINSSIKRSNMKKTKKNKNTTTAATTVQNVKHYNHNNKNSKRGLISYSSSSPETESSPARLSVFQRLMRSSSSSSSSNSNCKVEGKVKESFAVVKKSEDPYEDFRKSMMEMILEKQMFESKDLEQLLHCLLLSLNSKHHHPIIVQAFSEIWEFLFCSSSSL